MHREFEVVDHEMARILRAKTPAERLAIANRLWRFARQTIEAVVRSERPDWPAAQIQREVARRMSHGAI